MTSNGTTVGTYTDDHKDRLSVRTTTNITPSGTTQYLYDGADHVLAETNGSGTVVREYVWLGDLPWRCWTARPTRPIRRCCSCMPTTSSGRG